MVYLGSAHGLRKNTLCNGQISAIQMFIELQIIKIHLTGYKGEDILCLDEFNSSLNIQFMNNLLDCYPLTLPARYSNKQMCATKIYIISNISLDSQYKAIQYEYFSIYRAFLRRIHYIIKFNQDGSIDEQEYKGEMLYGED